MRRRRWARAAALCLAIVVVLQLAIDSSASAAGRPWSRRARGHAAHRGLPTSSSSPSPALPVVHHGVPKDKGGGRAVAFDAAARCNSSKPETASGRGAACADDDDKRVVPTGPNPLHNR